MSKKGSQMKQNGKELNQDQKIELWNIFELICKVLFKPQILVKMFE
jgi:hypothetical protein